MLRLDFGGVRVELALLLPGLLRYPQISHPHNRPPKASLVEQGCWWDPSLQAQFSITQAKLHFFVEILTKHTDSIF